MLQNVKKIAPIFLKHVIYKPATPVPHLIKILYAKIVDVGQGRQLNGLLSAFWERGSSDLPACGPRRGYASRPVRPIFINEAFKTLARGQASRGGRRKTSSGAASPGFLARSGEIKAGQTSRGSRDMSHDDQDQAGTSVCVGSEVCLEGG